MVCCVVVCWRGVGVVVSVPVSMYFLQKGTLWAPIFECLEYMDIHNSLLAYFHHIQSKFFGFC